MVTTVPIGPEVGLKLEMVGGPEVVPMVTVVLELLLLPAPVQIRVYVEVDVGDTTWVPEVALAPVQAPEALQAAALAEFQESVELLPEVIWAGEAEIETVGAGVPPPKSGGAVVDAVKLVLPD